MEEGYRRLENCVIQFVHQQRSHHYLTASTVSWRYNNAFHLVGFMSLVAAEDVKMKCNTREAVYIKIIH